MLEHIFTVVWIVWLLIEIVLNLALKSKPASSADKDKNSLSLIWITLVCAIICGIFSARWLEIPVTKSNWIVYAGLLAITGGIVIRCTAIFTLGKFFTVNVALHDQHTLIQHGFYKYIRHPAYTGSLLSFLGLGLSFNNWVSLAIVFIPILIAFLYRIHIEEKLLLESFGTAYAAYMNNTKRFIPGIY